MAGQRPRGGINRREALRTLATGIGATASALWVTNLLTLAEEQAAGAHLAMTASPQAATWTARVLSPHQLQTVGTLVELIIPTTNTPGAKAALVDRFVDSVLATSNPGDRTQFLAGLTWLEVRSTTLFGKNFTAATAAQQTDLLTRLSTQDKSIEVRTGVDFFTAIKSMTITGYYSTEIGLRQELGDDGRMVLPRFEGCTHREHQ